MLLTTAVLGQHSTDTLWGGGTLRTGYTIQAGAGFWNQENLNTLLQQNDRPVTRNFAWTGSMGRVWQWDKTRLNLLFLVMSNRNSGAGENLEQMFGGTDVSAEYAVVRKKGYAVSPFFGGGYIGGTLKIRQHAIAQPISEVFAQRNTTELFSQQGFMQAGLKIGFGYIPSRKAHLFQLCGGYRIGFLNTHWSTDVNADVLTDSVTDPLGQFYAGLSVIFLGASKTK